MNLKHMANRTMRLAYDRDSDVLYIVFGQPQSGLDEEVESGIFLRWDETTGSILGATVMDLERRFSGSLETVLPITLEEVAA